MIAFVILAFAGGVLTGAAAMAYVATRPGAEDRRSVARFDRQREALRVLP